MPVQPKPAGDVKSGEGSRSVPANLERLETDIREAGGPIELRRCSGLNLSRSTLVSMAEKRKPRYRRAVLVTLAQYFGKPDDYYLAGQTPRDAIIDVPLTRLRYEFGHRVIASKTYPEEVGLDGKMVKVNAYNEIRKLADSMGDLGYSVRQNVVGEACVLLVRDGILRYINPETFHIVPLKIDDVREYNNLRMPLEVARHEAAVKAIKDASTSDSCEMLIAKFDIALVDCEKSLSKGNGFRIADRRWHDAVFTPSTTHAVNGVFAACDQSYQKMRHYAKFVYGPGTPEYEDFIRRFNDRQLTTLKTITDEYRRRKRSRITEIVIGLRNHTKLQLDAWEQCQELVEIARKRGDLHELGYGTEKS